MSSLDRQLAFDSITKRDKNRRTTIFFAESYVPTCISVNMKLILGLVIVFAFGDCISGKAPELKGVKYKISVANNGNLVWMDRHYKFSMLPDYLKDTVLFQVPHKSISRGTIIELLVYQPSTIYIGHEGSRSGGFTTSLLSAGWELVTNKSPLRTGCCTLSNIWKKVVTSSGLTTISLPATTTGGTVHSIFVRETQKKCDDLSAWLIFWVIIMYSPMLKISYE